MDLMSYSLAGERVAEVLTGVNSILNTGGFQVLMAVGAVIGFIYFVLRWIAMSGKFATEGKTVILAYALIFGLLMPRTELIVKDVIKGSTTIVGDTPIGVALLSAGITQIGYQFTQLFSTALSTPTSQINPYSLDGGYLSPIQYIYLLRSLTESTEPLEMNEFSSNLQKDLHSYIRGCYIHAELKRNSSLKGQDIARSRSILASLAVNEPLRYIDMVEGRANCNSAYLSISTRINKKEFNDSILNFILQQVKTTQSLADPAKTGTNGQVPDNDAQKAALIDILNTTLGFTGTNAGSTVFIDPALTVQYYDPNGNDGVGTATASLEDAFLYYLDQAASGGTGVSSQDKLFTLMQNLYLFRSYNQSVKNYYSANPNQNAFGVALLDGITTKNMSMGNSAWSFAQYMVPVIGFIEALIYTLTPFSIILILILGATGLKTASMYILAFFWVSLWPMSYAIIHFWLVSDFMDAVNALSLTTSVYEMSSIYRSAMNALGAGGMWIGLVPMLTLFIVKGSMYTFNSIATQIQGTEHMNEKLQHRPTMDTEALWNYQGNVSQADNAVSAMLRPGVGANAAAPYQPNVGKVSTGQSYGSAMTEAQEYHKGTTATYQKLQANALQNVLSNEELHMSSYGFKLSNTENFTDAEKKAFSDLNSAQTSGQRAQGQSASNALKYATAVQLAAEAGLSGSAAVPLISAYLGMKAGGSELNAVENSYNQLDDSQKSVLASQAKSFLSSDEASKSISDLISYDKNLALQESSKEGVNKTLSTTLSESHDEMVQASEKVSAMQTQQEQIGSSKEMTTDMYYNLVSTKMEKDPAFAQHMSRVMNDGDTSEKAREKLQDPNFHNTWKNARLGQLDNGTFVHGNSEVNGVENSGLMFAATMAVIEETNATEAYDIMSHVLDGSTLSDKIETYQQKAAESDVAVQAGGSLTTRDAIRKAAIEANKGPLKEHDQTVDNSRLKNDVEENVSTREQALSQYLLNAEDPKNKYNKDALVRATSSLTNFNAKDLVEKVDENVLKRANSVSDNHLEDKLSKFATDDPGEMKKRDELVNNWIDAEDVIDEKMKGGEKVTVDDLAALTKAKAAAGEFLFGNQVLFESVGRDLSSGETEAITTHSPKDLLKRAVSDGVITEGQFKKISDTIEGAENTNFEEKNDAYKDALMKAYPEYVPNEELPEGQSKGDEVFSRLALRQHGKDLARDEEERKDPRNSQSAYEMFKDSLDKSLGQQIEFAFDALYGGQFYEMLGGDEAFNPKNLNKESLGEFNSGFIDLYDERGFGLADSSNKAFQDQVLRGYIAEANDKSIDTTGFMTKSFKDQLEEISENSSNPVLKSSADKALADIDDGDIKKVKADFYDNINDSVEDSIRLGYLQSIVSSKAQEELYPKMMTQLQETVNGVSSFGYGARESDAPKLNNFEDVKKFMDSHPEFKGMTPQEAIRYTDEQKEREKGDKGSDFMKSLKKFENILSFSTVGAIFTNLAQNEEGRVLSKAELENRIVEKAMSGGGEGEGVRQAALDMASMLSNGTGLDSGKSAFLDGYYRSSLANGSITDAQRIEGWAGMSTYERSMALAKIDGRIDTPEANIGKLGAVSNKSEQINSVLAQIISGQKPGR